MLDVTVEVPMQIATIEVEGAHVTRERAAFDKLQECAGEYEARYGKSEPNPLGAVEGVSVARSLFHALGMDPTKTRPASEALLRRALKGQSLFCINTLVDVVNWCSLDFLLPICVYDRDKISGHVVARPGEPDETYKALTGKDANLSGKYVLVDDTGPFGNPVTDSLRTAIGEDTANAVAIIFTPTEHDSDELTARARLTADRILEFCGGQVAGINVHQP
ncbi:MAG: B3/B4 domain-containing protein [Planctomycetota bacterium]|jgi:DNA/RNA-binding domain of Phe-tRNA-synthetase-like protein